MFNLIVFGPPGCGKGTQSKLIAKKFDFLHLSTGELFRHEIEQKSTLGKFYSKFINRGILIPDNVVLKELYRFALRNQDAKGIVFDGFPRTIEQAIALDRVFSKKELKIVFVVSILVNKNELINRVLERAQDSQRTDDTLEIIKKRLEIYEKHTLPVINYYKKTPEKVFEVSGEDDISVVSTKIYQTIKERIEKRNNLGLK